MPTKTSARRVLLAGVLTLLLGAVMMVAGSGMPPADERSGHATAIVALELVRTPAEVFRVLGPVGGEARAVLRNVVWVDFAFLLAYPLLQLAVVVFLTRGRAARGLAAALALAMAAGDALENRALLGLLALPSPDAPEAAGLVGSVELWTTVKWAALFAAALLTAVLLWARGGAARALAIVPLVTAGAGALGLLSPPRRVLVEAAGVYGLAVTWLVVLVLAAARLRTRA